MVGISAKTQFMRRHVLVQLGYAVLFNTAIAVFLTLVFPEPNFFRTLLISQCIGLTIFGSFYIAGHYVDLKGIKIVFVLLIGATCGVALGFSLAALLFEQVALHVDMFEERHIYHLLFNLFLALFFGSIILYFFISRERHFEASHALKESQIKNLDHKKQIAETQLQLLQAQIEPHFLFNSLSNVISLIENEPEHAKQMLESLTRYLRASLSRSHDKNGNLKDELDLIENYLKIIQIRMGDRLHYQINVDPDLLGHIFPLMLLQPLVENAIQHGLEPLAEGGCVTIDINKNANSLKIQIIDNGVGLKGEQLKGYGLLNVRERLKTQFGDKGRLTLGDNSPQGVIVSIEMPYV